MYRNIVCYNSEKSIKGYEQKLLSSMLFDNIQKFKIGKKEVAYKNNEVLISVSKKIVSYLVFNQDNYKVIDAIELLESKRGTQYDKNFRSSKTIRRFF